MNNGIPRTTAWAWATGSLATGAVFNAMSLFALFYMTSVLGVGAALAGSLLFAVRLYDAVTDPVMGAISDRTRHRWGPQRPYLLLGAVALPLSFALFFNLANLSVAVTGTLLLAALVLYSTSYTVFAVPYLAMSPTLAPSYDGRTRLMSMRVGFMIVGVMIGSAGGPLLVDAAGDGAAGYSALGFGLGGLAVAAGLIAFAGTAASPTVGTGQAGQPPAAAVSTASNRQDTLAAEPLPTPGQRSGASQPPVQGNPFVQALDVFRHAPFRLLTLVKLLQLAVLALALACTPFFFRYVLERPTVEISYYLALFSLAGLVSLAPWRWIITRRGKREVYIVSVTLYGLGMASWFLWQPGEAEWLFYARAALLGVFSNGTLVCALALLPDTMEYDRLASGQNREGMMSGIFTTVEKIAGALGPLIVGLLLEASGFVEGTDAATQPESALMAVKLGISLVPALICLAAVPVLIAYRLGPTQLEAMRGKEPSAGVREGEPLA